MKTELFVAVHGGVVRSVRLGMTPTDVSTVHCFVVDYDTHTDTVIPVPEFEKTKLGGRTWREIERVSSPVF
jgi:hypothetical protein